MTEHNPPTLAEIAALTARLHVLSTTGAAADPAERAAFVADKDALIARITATEQADDSTQARAEAGGYALVGPSARTWRTDPATGQPVEPASEAEHQAVRELLGRDVLTTTEPAWTDGEVVSAVIPLADNNGYWADTASDEQIDNPAELGLTGGEGPPIDAGPALTAEEAARELAADGIPLDHARALVRSYLDDVSAHVGTPVHQWGLDEADLADIRAYAGDPGPVHDLDEGDPWADYRTYTAVEAADQLIARGIPPDRAPGIIQRYRDEQTAARGEPSDVRELDDDDLTRMLAPTSPAAAPGALLPAGERAPARPGPGEEDEHRAQLARWHHTDAAELVGDADGRTEDDPSADLVGDGADTEWQL